MTARPALLLLVLIFAASAVNLTKALHIDDTAYLEIAQAILKDPLHPMTYELNWGQTAEPIHRINQPHLYFYAMALMMALFGGSELAPHFLMMIMTASTIVMFYLLARLLLARHAMFLTALLALGPAFLPGQNLMVDVPVLALWLPFFYALFSAEARPGRWYLVAGGLAAAACLVKYVSLVLLPILVITLAYRRHWRYLPVLAIPALTLVAWSGLNYLDYGGIHILERSAGQVHAGSIMLRLLEWIAGLGAVAPFSLAFASQRALRRVGTWLLAAALALLVLLFVISFRLAESYQIAALWTLFVGNGLLVLALANYHGFGGNGSERVGTGTLPRDRATILVLWSLAVLSFTVLFAPFMAVRHILLAVPPLLLLLGSGLQSYARLGRKEVAGLGLTAALGLLLAVSDYSYANVYRRYAPQIATELGNKATIWYTGHWGWQWYADKAGMQQYDRHRTDLKAGDYVVIPALGDLQAIRPDQEQCLQEVGQVVIPAGPMTWVRTMSTGPLGGYYAFSFFPSHGPPWRFTTAPLETFSIWVVVDSCQARLTASDHDRTHGLSDLE